MKQINKYINKQTKKRKNKQRETLKEFRHSNQIMLIFKRIMVTTTIPVVLLREKRMCLYVHQSKSRDMASSLHGVVIVS